MQKKLDFDEYREYRQAIFDLIQEVNDKTENFNFESSHKDLSGYLRMYTIFLKPKVDIISGQKDENKGKAKKLIAKYPKDKDEVNEIHDSVEEKWDEFEKSFEKLQKKLDRSVFEAEFLELEKKLSIWLDEINHEIRTRDECKSIQKCQEEIYALLKTKVRKTSLDCSSIGPLNYLYDLFFNRDKLKNYNKNPILNIFF